MTLLSSLRARLGAFSQILLMRLYAAGMSFLLTLVLSRLLGPAAFGAYVFALGWVSIAILFTTFGFHHFTIRTIPPLLHENKASDALGVVLFAALFIALLSMGTTVFARLNLPLFAGDPGLQAAVAVASLLLVPRSWILLRTGVMQGLGHPVAGQVPERLIEPSLLLIAVLFCALVGWPLGAESLLYLTFGVLLISLLAGLPSFWRAMAQIATRPRFTGMPQWVGGAAKSSLVFAAGTVLGATDVVMLGLLSTPEETGLYGVAVRFFLLLGLPFHATGVYLAQQAATLTAQGDTAGLQVLSRKAVLRTVLSCLVLAVPSTIAAFFVAEIFGAGFAAAGAVILLLVWARVALAFFGEPAVLLANSQHVGRVSLLMAFAALLNIALNALLAGPLGAMGAALATVISYVALTLALSVSIRAVLGIRCFHLPRLSDLSKEDAI